MNNQTLFIDPLFALMSGSITHTAVRWCSSGCMSRRSRRSLGWHPAVKLLTPAPRHTFCFVCVLFFPELLKSCSRHRRRLSWAETRGQSRFSLIMRDLLPVCLRLPLHSCPPLSVTRRNHIHTVEITLHINCHCGWVQGERAGQA